MHTESSMFSKYAGYHASVFLQFNLPSFFSSSLSPYPYYWLNFKLNKKRDPTFYSFPRKTHFVVRIFFSCFVHTYLCLFTQERLVSTFTTNLYKTYKTAYFVYLCNTTSPQSRFCLFAQVKSNRDRSTSRSYRSKRNVVYLLTILFVQKIDNAAANIEVVVVVVKVMHC